MNEPQFKNLGDALGEHRKKLAQKPRNAEEAMMQKLARIASPAKRTLAEFLFRTNKEEEVNTFSFVLSNATHADAENFVHNMRVHLSKLRKRKQEEGSILKPFKMIVLSIDSVDKGQKITLERTTSTRMKTRNMAQDFLGDLVAD